MAGSHRRTVSLAQACCDTLGTGSVPWKLRGIHLLGSCPPLTSIICDLESFACAWPKCDVTEGRTHSLFCPPRTS